VSIWLDDLSRERLETGNLADLVANSHVVGVTSNPSIFQAALSDGERYDPQIRELAARGADTDETVRILTTDDVRDGCKVLRPVFDATDHVDGRVSIASVRWNSQSGEVCGFQLSIPQSWWWPTS